MKKTNYLFHFIISETMTKYIGHLKKELGFNKDIELYDYMLEIMSKNLSQLKGIIGDHQSEYALIDSPEIKRVHKYARLKENNFKRLKNWHSNFNEYSMSTILRDIIKLFYDGIVKYGVEKFIQMISKNIDIRKIRYDMKDVLTQLLGLSLKKAALFSLTIKNLSFYT